MNNNCELCKIWSNITAKVHYQDEHVLCLDCKQKNIPMWVLKIHSRYFSLSMMHFIRDKSDELWDDVTGFCWETRRGKDHVYCHVLRRRDK
jgi:hypothetical protein